MDDIVAQSDEAATQNVQLHSNDNMQALLVVEGNGRLSKFRF